MIAKPPFPRLNHAHPLAQGLVGAWLFYEGSGGTIYDLAGRGLPGSFIDAPTWQGGIAGWSLSLDGSNDGVEVADNPALTFGSGTADSPFSVAFRVFPVGTPAGCVIGKATGSGTGEWYALFSGGALFFRLADNSTGGFIGRSVAAVSGNTWHTIVCTYDGSGADTGIKIYVDGSQVATAAASSGSYTAMENTAVPLRFGRRDAAGTWFSGRIDCALLYGRELAASEAASLYRDPHAAFRERPPLYLRKTARSWFYNRFILGR